MLDNRLYYTNVWKQTIACVQQQENNPIDSVTVSTFYNPAFILQATPEKILIQCESAIAVQILKSNSDNIQLCLQSILDLDKPVTVEFGTAETFKNSNDVDDSFILEKKDHILENQTFENFVVGESNRECFHAALGFALNASFQFNPLFIYGNSGLGKTHLLNAIANKINTSNKTSAIKRKVFYIDTQNFIEGVASNIKNNSIDAFKKFFYSLDVLLIDNIQFLCKKDKSQEIFFTIFNELINNGKQICIVSDNLPNELKGLEERLRTRFNSGLYVGVDSPEFETALEILKIKLKNLNRETYYQTFEETALEYIASNFSKDIRTLEGALNRILFVSIQSKNTSDKITLELVTDALKDQAMISDKTGVTPKKIINAVADYYSLTSKQITSKTRTSLISTARHIAIYLCRAMIDLPYTKIGEVFGNRDHSTIMNSCSKIESLIKTNNNYKIAVEKIKQNISG